MLIIKKAIAAAIAFTLIFSAPAAFADGAPEVSAASAVVMHSGGEIVYEKNADEKLLIASTTKIMTALVVLENAALDDVVEIQPQCCGLEGSSMYLRSGDRYTVRELLCGLLLVSGNDAAEALAVHTAGSTEKFVCMMNDTAQRLGMSSTHFANPHGLNAEGHYSTARDMARLMERCMENDSFAGICGMTSCTVGGQTLINHNRLLSMCPGCIGGKTGYTMAAGRCLVSCCERGGTRFICVTLSAPDDWNDHMKLYDWAFSNYSERIVTEGVAFDVPIISGNSSSARLVPESLSLFLPNSAEVTLEAELPWFVFAPVKAGDVGGSVAAYIDGEKLGESDLVYESDIQAAERIFKQFIVESLK